ncbi:MAG: hypothetical protein M3Z49_10640, partial [Bifidobacteriales bacterium]|nr:hypothetical protein [Bifidobacteriales bacterium]
CISEHVMFKYLRDKQQYRSSNTKYAGRSSNRPMTAFISVLVVVGLYNRMRSGDTLISVP